MISVSKQLNKNANAMRMRMLWMRMGDDTALNMKFSIKDFFSKCDQSAGNGGLGHIY